ncbi:MAG: hypothetical protein PHE32_03570 [Candidatus Shapirobacteria bacterium]|nr:hypothetical protein [Candidatus Shapirobacteria bacterium]MDD4410753.1 hypothetical protein [Candidatus Shapirobacteria bacterium]
MNIECEHREIFNRKIYAIDGIGGSGKSHSLIKLSESLKSNENEVVISKIAGMGNSERVGTLKKILYAREEQRKQGNQTERQLEDHKKQKLFRLATKYQTNLFLKSLDSYNENTYHLLDRTPLMTLAFCLSEDPNNPYIDEIKEEALKLTKLLNIKKIFLLDIDPVISISRQLARSTIGVENQDSMINNALDIIQPPSDVREKIILNTKKIIEKNPNLLKKEISLWDYSSYNVIVNESRGFHQALEIAKQEIGLEYIVIETDKPIDDIVSIIKSHII